MNSQKALGLPLPERMTWARGFNLEEMFGREYLEVIISIIKEMTDDQQVVRFLKEIRPKLDLVHPGWLLSHFPVTPGQNCSRTIHWLASYTDYRVNAAGGIRGVVVEEFGGRFYDRLVETTDVIYIRDRKSQYASQRDVRPGTNVIFFPSQCIGNPLYHRSDGRPVRTAWFHELRTFWDFAFRKNIQNRPEEEYVEY